jgi:hypothetical protein
VTDATRPLFASLSVPTQASMVGTVRVFVERVLGDLTTPQALDDLRVAVGEACASMRGTRLHVVLEVSEERCHVSCRGVRPPGDDDDDVMRAQLLEALAPDARWLPGDEVRFSVALSA